MTLFYSNSIHMDDFSFNQSGFKHDIFIEFRLLLMTLVSCRRMIAELCWQSRRSTVCLRRFRSSSTSSLSWQTTFSWMPASQSPSLRYRVVRLWPWPHQIQPMLVKSTALFKTVHLLFVCFRTTESTLVQRWKFVW